VEAAGIEPASAKSSASPYMRSLVFALTLRNPTGRGGERRFRLVLEPHPRTGSARADVSRTLKRPESSNLTQVSVRGWRLRPPERSCRRWHTIFCSQFNEASCILGMRLGFLQSTSKPDRPQSHPYDSAAGGKFQKTLSRPHQALLVTLPSRDPARTPACRAPSCRAPGRCPAWPGCASSTLPAGSGYSPCARPSRSAG